MEKFFSQKTKIFAGKIRSLADSMRVELLGTLLTELYGAKIAQDVRPKLIRLVELYSALKSNHPASRSDLPLTERDALLITYPDQLTAPGKAPLQVLRRFCQSYLSGVITGIHLLPFYPSSSDDGFAVIDYRAVAPEFGGWEHIERLAENFSLMFDAVFNHVSAQSAWFQSFVRDQPPYRDFFMVVSGAPDLSQVVRPRALPLLTTVLTPSGPKKVWTTFSADQVDLNARNPRLLLELIDTLLFYVSKGARFIRLDAIAFLWKEIGTACLHHPQTHRIIRLLRALLDQTAPSVLLVTETNVPHSDNISYFGDGANEAQLVYNFALPPLVLHSFLTRQSSDLTRWAEQLRLPSRRVAFFNFLASHDGIGLNPVRGLLSDSALDHLVQETLARGGFVSYKSNPDGSRAAYELNITFFDALSDPREAEPAPLAVARFMAAQAILLGLAGLPGIYFHSLFGSRNDRESAETSGIPRRINRRKFRLAEFEAVLAKPDSLAAQVFSQSARLLRIRRNESAFHPVAEQQILTLDNRVFAFMRRSLDEKERVLCLHNLTPSTFKMPVRLPDLRPGQLWLDLIQNETHVVSMERSLLFEFLPYQVFWLKN